MADKGEGLLDRLAMRRSLARWRRAADEVTQQGLAELGRLRRMARAQREQIDRFLHGAEARMALPGRGRAVAAGLPGTDWAWRPDLWCGPLPDIGHAGADSRTQLGEGATLFHDCRVSEVVTRQMRNPGEGGAAPYGLRLEVFHFDGSFLSLALDLPAEAVQGLKTRHLIRLDMRLEMDSPLEIFARLNVKHGPNVEQIVRELPVEDGRVTMEFDMFYTELNEKRVEQAWLDLIFERPAQNLITLRDVTLSRRPRAEL